MEYLQPLYLLPTLDHPTGADHALEGFAALVGAVEQRAVAQRAAVLGGDQRTLDHRFAIAELNVFDQQFIVHSCAS